MNKNVVIGRPINGISINGLEYVLDENGDEMLFESEAEAKQFLIDNGFTEEDIENQGIVFVDENYWGD